MKRIKGLVCMGLCMCVLMSIAPLAVMASGGSCGENITWELDEAGTLTLSGSGDMDDYTLQNAPWHSDVEKIKKVVIGEGITSVGDYSLMDCKNLTEIVFPKTLEEIGVRAFSSCAIKTLVLPLGLKKIGGFAFLVCESLESVTIPEGVEEIDDFAFEYCTALTTVKLPKSLKKMGMCVFRICESLKDVYYAGSEEDWNNAKIEHNWAFRAGEYTFHYNSINSDKQIILTIGQKTALVNGEVVENDVAPQIVNGRTMLPIRFLAETLGADVYWDGTTGVVSIIESIRDKMVKVKKSIVLKIGSDEAVVDNEIVMLDAPAFVQDGRTFLPVRFITEELGCYVEWIAETQQVLIERY